MGTTTKGNLVDGLGPPRSLVWQMVDLPAISDARLRKNAQQHFSPAKSSKSRLLMFLIEDE